MNYIPITMDGEAKWPLHV